MKTDFELRITSPTSFEISASEDVQDLIFEAVKRYYVMRVDTEEQMIREGLIALGWTPPTEKALSAERTTNQSRFNKICTHDDPTWCDETCNAQAGNQTDGGDTDIQNTTVSNTPIFNPEKPFEFNVSPLPADAGQQEKTK